MLRNIRTGLKGLALQPAATAAAVFTLGLAIGAQATILSVVDGLWFRPPGVPAAHRLLRVFSVSESEREGRWSRAARSATPGHFRPTCGAGLAGRTR